MAETLNCAACGARLAPGAQWCSLCLTPTAAVESPAEPVAPARAEPPTGVPSAQPSDGTSPMQQPADATAVPPPTIPAARVPESVPVVPIEADPDPGLPEGLPASADPEQWAEMLALHESSRPAYAQALSRRSVRWGVAVGGAIIVIVIATVAMLVASRVFG